VVEIRIDGLLEERGRSFYWLAKETGVSHTTLWRLKKGRARGINFDTLEKLCRALDCEAGDIIHVAGDEKSRRPRAGSRGRTARAAGLRRPVATKGAGVTKGGR
jgi:putative transcriptional regulator